MYWSRHWASVSAGMLCRFWIGIRPVEQVPAHRRGVADRRHPVLEERPLDEEVPLTRLPVLEVTVEPRFADAVDLRRGGIAADRRRDRCRIGKPDHRHAARGGAIRRLRDTRGEVGRAIVGRSGEVAGVARQIGDAEAAAKDRAVIDRVRRADSRSPVVVSGVPQVPAVAVDTRERNRALGAERIRGLEVPRRHAIEALGRAGLDLPAQAEVDRQLRRRPASRSASRPRSISATAPAARSRRAESTTRRSRAAWPPRSRRAARWSSPAMRRRRWRSRTGS